METIGQTCPLENKTMSSESSSVRSLPENPALASDNQALARCREAFETTCEDMLADGKSDCAARMKANQAYKSALPPLIGADNIRDFLACVANGMLIGAIDDDKAARLLYAARAAQSTLRNLPADKQPVQSDPPASRA